MALKKKEKTMVIVLGLVIYVFAFVKFVLLSSIPKIKETQQALHAVQMKKEALEADYRNINAFIAELDAKTVADDRLGEYLMNNAGLTDSIEFIEKLALMMDTSIEKISLGQPTEMTEKGGTKYYGFPIKFNASFSYPEMEEVITYCEGGSRKVRIAGFGIRPDTSSDKASGEQIFSISMDLVFYSLDKNAADNLYQYSLSRLQEFKNRDGSPLFIKEDAPLPEADLPNPQTVSIKEQTIVPASVITMDNADFIVIHRGYLYGGFNFETFSMFNSKGRLRKTTAGKMDVLLTLSSHSYTIQSTDDAGRTDTVSGDIPNRNFTMYIKSDIDTRVKENENLQVNIKVMNDSGKDLRVQLEQTGGRVRLLDREGNEIIARNDKERVYL